MGDGTGTRTHDETGISLTHAMQWATGPRLPTGRWHRDRPRGDKREDTADWEDRGDPGGIEDQPQQQETTKLEPGQQ